MTILKHNILLIGGAGFIGKAFVKQINHLFNITVLEPDCTKLSVFKEYGVHTICGELKDLNLIESTIKKYKISTVVHLASKLIPSSGLSEFQEEIKEIISPTVQLIHFCSLNKVRFVFFSSGGTIYGETNDNLPIKEDSATHPISYYGLSKKIIEDCIIFENRISELRFLILRPSNAYGPGQNIFGQQGLIGVALRKVLYEEPLIIWGDGCCVRDYIYIEDLCSVIAQLLTNTNSNHINNIGSGIGYTINEVIDSINKITGKTLVVEYQQARKNDVTSIVLDNTLMQGLVPARLTTLSEGIKQFCEYEKRRI